MKNRNYESNTIINLSLLQHLLNAINIIRLKKQENSRFFSVIALGSSLVIKKRNDMLDV
jgi:hypothetical protein